MAALTLKVSEEKYKETIARLSEKIDRLEECLGDLVNQRQKLQREYQGHQAEAAIDTIRTNEENVTRAIEEVRRKRDDLQNYLDSMGVADTNIKNTYNDAHIKAANVFK